MKCSDYDYKEVKETIRKSLSSFGGLESFIGENDTVLIKPNLLSPVKPESGIITHPTVVRSVIELVKETNAEVIVGESSGGMNEARSLTEKSFEVSGLKDVCRENEVKFVNFDRVKSRMVENSGNTEDEFPLPEPLLDADFIISVPKLKTHSLTMFTGSIKNCYGCIPGMKKAEYHKLYPDPNDFAEVIVDIFNLINPDLAIMDGVEALEGNGPGEKGEKFQLGTIITSTDLVALDIIASSFLGFDENSVPINNIASDKNLGTNNIDDIEMKGDFIPPKNKRKLPDNNFLNFLPNWITKRIGEKLLTKPKINKKDCIYCGRCLNSCPQEAISETKNGMEINEEECIKCLCCQEVCPEGAVGIDQFFIFKMIREYMV